MSPEAFKRSLSSDQPPPGTAPPLVALWWSKKGDWDRAHEIVMNDEGSDAAWVHAHLHRVEGDDVNAGYWYRQARKRAAGATAEVEWDMMVADLLAK